MNHQKTSFSYKAKPGAKILILGSMPGDVSIAAIEYYAHPRNLFWDFMQQLLGIPRDLGYAERLELLQDEGVALWDVLGACKRVGSLDSNIEASSEQANDISALLEQYPSINAVFFNGNKAYASFKRHILKQNPELEEQYDLIPLPSTSPANASVSVEDKFSAWKQILEYIKQK